jgi:hypothetical protein
MAEIRKLSVAQPDEDRRQRCIEELEKLLEKAKSGNIISFLVVCNHPGNEWSYINSGHNDSIQVIGELQMMLYRVSSQLFSDD